MKMLSGNGHLKKNLKILIFQSFMTFWLKIVSAGGLDRVDIETKVKSSLVSKMRLT